MRGDDDGPTDVPGGLDAAVYDELRELARSMMRRERSGHTLQPTAVVHEAWVRIAGRPDAPFGDRAAFLRYVARVMRNLLVDHARALATHKRGDGARAADDAVLQIVVSEHRPEPIAMLDLDAALSRLAARDAELAQLVELRFLAGMTIDETAAALGRTPRQVRRAWELARACLLRELDSDSTAG